MNDPGRPLVIEPFILKAKGLSAVEMLALASVRCGGLHAGDQPSQQVLLSLEERGFIKLNNGSYALICKAFGKMGVDKTEKGQGKNGGEPRRLEPGSGGTSTPHSCGSTLSVVVVDDPQDNTESNESNNIEGDKSCLTIPRELFNIISKCLHVVRANRQYLDAGGAGRHGEAICTALAGLAAGGKTMRREDHRLTALGSALINVYPWRMGMGMTERSGEMIGARVFVASARWLQTQEKEIPTETVCALASVMVAEAIIVRKEVDLRVERDGNTARRYINRLDNWLLDLKWAGPLSAETQEKPSQTTLDPFAD